MMTKVLGKVGNIAEACFPSRETLLRKQNFHFAILGNIVAETKFASQEAKMFPNKFRSVLVVRAVSICLPVMYDICSILSNRNKGCVSRNQW